MPEPAPLPRHAGVSDLLETATRLFRESLLKCLPLAMGATLLAMLSTIYLLVTGQQTSSELPRDPAYWALYVAGACGSLLFTAALIVRLRAQRAGTHSTAFEDLRAALQRWPTVLAASAVGAVLVMFGVLALIVPGVYIAVCLVPLNVVAVLEPVDALTAVRRSFALIRPMWLKTFACLVIAALVVVVCLFTAGLVLNLIAGILEGNSVATVSAVTTTGMLVVLAAATVFLSALCLTLYSAASSSA